MVRHDTVRRSILPDSKADLPVYGMGESAIVEILGRMASGEKVASIRGVPALAEVRFGLVSSRGCFGACSFCSLIFTPDNALTYALVSLQPIRLLAVTTCMVLRIGKRGAEPDP